jgi:nucleoside permease NupC
VMGFLQRLLSTLVAVIFFVAMIYVLKYFKVDDILILYVWVLVAWLDIAVIKSIG